MEPKEVIIQDGADREKAAEGNGKITLFKNGDVDFRMYATTGESTRENLVKMGDALTYTTKGKRPMRVITLKVHDDDPARCAKLKAQFDEAVSKFDEGRFEKPKKRGPKYNVLWDKEDMKVELIPNGGKVAIHQVIDLDTIDGMNDQVFKNVQSLYQCFTINKQLILSAFRAHLKSSSTSQQTPSTEPSSNK